MSSDNAENDETGTDLVALDSAVRRRSDRAEKAAFAKRLGELIHGRGMRQADLARKSNLAPHLISTYVLGKAIPGRLNLEAIARALSVDPASLVPQPIGETDTFADNSPMALAVNPRNPAVANLRINMMVRTELGSEIIQLLLKDAERAS